jgi:hypothetical protein
VCQLLSNQCGSAPHLGECASADEHFARGDFLGLILIVFPDDVHNAL